MRPMKPDPGIRVQAVRIPTENGGMSALLLSPLAAPKNAAGILWLHGGGYIAGMKEMVHASRAVDLVKKFGAVVLSPGYRLAPKAPSPAAIDDCYAALLYLKAHAAAFGVRSEYLTAPELLNEYEFCCVILQNEESMRLKPYKDEEHGRYFISCEPNSENLSEFIRDWGEMRDKLKSQEITQEEYEEWKITWDNGINIMARGEL